MSNHRNRPEVSNLRSIAHTAKEIVKQAIKKTQLLPSVYKITHPSKESFSCPICHYHGPFADLSPETGRRKHAKCPCCGARERHRLQFVVMNSLADKYDFSTLSLLHFAPETCFRGFFEDWFGNYSTADLRRRGVDHNVDLTDLPFSDQAYDCVYASHVLEHIKDDRKALSEIRRILKPGGFAILPVPLVAKLTVEYPAPNPHESGHVRAPGFDYVQRYEEFFDSVEEYGTEDYPTEYQLYMYEDRSSWPTETMPLRPPMRGDRHVDKVPVCHVRK